MDICSKIDDDDTLSGLLLDDSLIGDHGTTARTALYVAIPGLRSRQDITEMPAKRPKLDHHWMVPLEDADFVRAEFDLDELSTVQTKQDPIIQPPRLSVFLNDCGGFPSSYFVRTEETMFLRSISDVILAKSPQKAVLVGSPGVGKSCFLMLMGFYFAFCKHEQVLIVRKTISFGFMNAVIYSDGKCSDPEPPVWLRTSAECFCYIWKHFLVAFTLSPLSLGVPLCPCPSTLFAKNRHSTEGVKINNRVSSVHQLAAAESIADLFSTPSEAIKLRADIYRLCSFQSVVIKKLRALIPEAKNSDARNVLQALTDNLIRRNTQVENLISGTLDRDIINYRAARLKKKAANQNQEKAKSKSKTKKSQKIEKE
ncbi:hypothetical protein AC1031_002446 [Aphanomyces cochlioides]|nr:hypothetical protein AC1031_002446 [Aphanomyces cochlioides]